MNDRRLLVGAFVLSALIHLFGGALWARGAHVVAQIMRRLPEQHPREQEVATSDVVRLEHRTIPRPAQAGRPHSPTRPTHRSPAPPLTPIAAAAKPSVEPEHRVARPAPPAAPEIAHHKRKSPPLVQKPAATRPLGAGAPRSTSAATLSAAQLAQLDARFSQTIAASRVDLATVEKRTQEAPATIKRYPMQFTGEQASLQRGEGYIEPITPGQRIGNAVWYYAHYTYMWPDGHLEDDDIPWPFRYPVGHDLFALHIHLIPLQLPPPGFRLTRPLKPFLAHFVQTAGQG